LLWWRERLILEVTKDEPFKYKSQAVPSLIRPPVFTMATQTVLNRH